MREGITPYKNSNPWVNILQNPLGIFRIISGEVEKIIWANKALGPTYANTVGC